MSYAMEPIAGPSLPRSLAIELACDGDHGLFPPAPFTFVAKPGEDPHRAATRAGWSVTDRIRCPSCIGRRP